MQHTDNSNNPAPQISPNLIASGLGLSSRAELCGLVALMDSISTFEIIRGAGEGLAHRIGADLETAADRMARFADELQQSTINDVALRHRLWNALTNALGGRVALPLSERRLADEAGALGVLVSRALSPGIIAENRHREQGAAGSPSAVENAEQFIRDIWNHPSKLWEEEAPLLFPEIVARELASLLDNVDLDHDDPKLDPDIQHAMLNGGKQGWAGIAAAGGWVSVATAVNTAGFAPYILAAKASAFLPFVGGPAAVSFLAVMVNPVTVAIGLLAIGLGGGQRIGNVVRRQAAARVAVLLALRGLEDPRRGLGVAVTDFRRLCAPGAHRPDHLCETDWSALRTQVVRVEATFGGSVPDAPGAPPAPWGFNPANVAEHPFGEALAMAGLTAADMLYHAAAIDPRVLAAADFWRTAEIDNPLEFALHASEFAVSGADIALRGFTAEQVVMGRLIEEGHSVALPPSSSNPGFDLIVDGNPVQVKCANSLSQLQNHFATYPDIPVIANAELVQQLSDQPWAGLVTTIEGFELEAIEALMDSSVQAGMDLADPDLFGIAIGVGAVRGVFGVIKGEIPAEHLPAWMVVDNVMRGSLVLAGAKVGAGIGLVVIGPAGALVLGPAMGAAAATGVGYLRPGIDKLINREWHGDLCKAAGQLHHHLIHAIRVKIDILADRRNQIRAGLTPESGAIIREWLQRRADEDVMYAAECLELLRSPPVSLGEFMELDLLATRLAPAESNVLLARNRLRTLLKSPPGPLDGWMKHLPASLVPATVGQ